MNALEEAVARGRERAEARMLDTCRIDIVRSTTDPVTHRAVQTIVRTLYPPGPCRLRNPSNVVSDVQSADQSLAEQALVLSLPVATSGDVVTDAIVSYLAVDPATGDESLVGLTFRIKGTGSQSQATANRFPVEVLT